MKGPCLWQRQTWFSDLCFKRAVLHTLCFSVSWLFKFLCKCVCFGVLFNNADSCSYSIDGRWIQEVRVQILPSVLLKQQHKWRLTTFRYSKKMTSAQRLSIENLICVFNYYRRKYQFDKSSILVSLLHILVIRQETSPGLFMLSHSQVWPTSTY
jgi:hypothetical protein